MKTKIFEMKSNSLVLLFAFFLFPFSFLAQNLSEIYDSTLCGLNYTQASALLTNRNAAYSGTPQPASLIINAIPNNAKIEKAFAWWDVAGTDTIQNITIQNPNAQTNSFAGVVSGGGNNFCNGNGYSFRADVTSIISGNGNYLVSGLPSDSSLASSDVTGITLFIIYSDIYSAFAGTLKINDGYLKISQDTITETITDVHTIFDDDTSLGTAFMIISEMEAQPGNAIQMSNGTFIVPVQDFWDYEEKLAAYPYNQTNYTFGVRSPNDCSQLIMLGVYFQENVEILEPTINSVYGDNLTVSTGSSYQWFLDNSPITNSDVQTYLASQSGNYFAEVSDQYGCAFSSDTISFVVCAERIKPNINFSSPDSLWTDSVNYPLQWYADGSAIPNATLPYYVATITGSYWVQSQDASSGCSVNSDIIPVNIDGIDETQSGEIIIYPNPNNGCLSLTLSCREGTIEIYSLRGEKIYSEKILNPKSLILNLGFPSGLYLLKITGEDFTAAKKIVVE